MRTLDEVINIFEKACDLEKRCEECDGCLSQENGCPNDGAEAVPDALHYLKWFRARDNMSRRMDREDNEPLTWEQLIQMEDKPVWVETEQCGSHWYIIESVDDDMVIVVGKYCERVNYYRDDDFIRWNAYRKERNEKLG